MICGADAVDVVVDVHAVGHGLLVGVFHDQVLVEEAEGLLGGRGGEADEVGVEVFQHLRPEVVDGAVALVGDDEVEGLDGDLRVVLDGHGLSLKTPSPVLRPRPRRPPRPGSRPLSMEYRRWIVLMQTRAVVSSVLPVEPLDDVLLGELEVVVGRDVLLEFLERLLAEVAAVHQEQDAPRAGELDEPVDEVDGGEGLARAGGHLDEGARTVFGQRLFEIPDGGDLRGPEAFGL